MGTNWLRCALDVLTEKAHRKKGKGKEEDRGGSLVNSDKEQKQEKRAASYRGQDMTTCSTVSMVVGHVEHILDVEQ